MVRQVLENGVVLPSEYSDDWYDDMTSNLTKLDDVIGSDSEKLSSADVGAAALSNNYNDLDNLPTIPTVNDATLTIQKNGVDVQTFTANASSNVTCNITVPTKTSDITNDSNFVDTSNSAVASGITSAKVTDYDTHIADTDIHVTTADKSKWNNGVSQSYVFRYSSTALVASSTNSNALLDNTDNLKVGDKVIDSDGVLFSITAIDTVNSTFTVGSALVDLALDANVVHTSGNENVGGIKNFTDETYIKSLNFTNEVASPSSSSSSIMPLVTTVTYTDQTASKSARINLRITASGDKAFYPNENNQYSLGLQSCKWSEVHATTYYYGSSDTEFSQKFVTTDTDQTVGGNKTLLNSLTLKGSYILWKNDTVTKGTIPASTVNIYRMYLGSGSGYGQSLFNIDCSVGNDGTQRLTFRSAENVVNGDDARLFVYYNPNRTQPRYVGIRGNIEPYNSDTYECGTSENRWKSFNGLEPSSLSLPSGNVSDVIDISSYISDLSGNANTYTAPANGWISIAVVGTAIAIVSSSWSDSRLRASSGDVRMLYPVLKNETLGISVTGTTLAYARFIPCQGNV